MLWQVTRIFRRNAVRNCERWPQEGLLATDLLTDVPNYIGRAVGPILYEFSDK